MDRKPTYEELEERVLELEKTLQEREAILDQLPDILVVQDLNHRILWSNQAASQSVDIEKADLAGRRCHELWGFRSAPCPNCPLPDLLADKGQKSVEKTTPDGKSWRLRCRRLNDPRNQDPRILEIAEDITETVKIREVKTAAEKHRNLILETMRELLAFHDTELRIRWANKAAADSVGKTVNELIGRHCYEIWHQRDTPCADCPVVNVIQTGEFHECEVSSPDGRIFHLRGYPAYDDKDTLIGVVEYGLDITGLRYSENRYRMIFMNSPIGIFRSTLEGRFLEVNPALAEMLGYDSPDAVIREVSHIGEQLYSRIENHQRIIREQLQSNDISHHVNQYRRKDGSWFTANLYLKTARDSEGRPMFFEGIVEDITKRVQAEEDLQTATISLETAVQAANVGLWDWNLISNHVRYSSEWKKQIGYEESEIGNRFEEWESRVHPDDLSSTIDHIQNRIASGHDGFQVEFRFRHKNGTYRWIFAQASIQKDENGRPIRVLGSHIDITEYKSIQEKNRELQNRLQSLWNIAQMTEASHQELCNLVTEETQKLTGSQYSFFGLLSEDERILTIQAWSPSTMFDCATFERYIHFPIESAGLWAQAVITRKPFIVNDVARKHPRKKGLPDGHVLIENLLSVPIIRQGKVVALAATANKEAGYTTDDANQVQAFVSNIILLLEKRLSDEALGESESKYKSIMEAMDDSVYICSSDFRIKYMNPTFKKKLGRNATGEICHKALYNRDQRCPWCVYDKIMQGETVNYELYNPVDGKTYNISNSPIVHMDRSVSKLSLLRDISEIKKIHRHIQQTQKMEALGSLAGGIAHDFNNILFPIIGMAEMLLEDLTPGSMVHKNAQSILAAGKRGNDLVKQILAFSRQSENQRIPIRVQQVLKEAIGFIRATIPADIEIHRDIQADCGPVHADPTQIHQIAMNLITNAFHALEQTGGNIFVRLKEEAPGEDDTARAPFQPGRYAKLTVSDTGCGIEPAVLDQIFEPYFTTKDKEKGTGLGLSVVYGIVQEHGGNIQVYSEVGKGTTVTVFLPVLEKSAETEAVEKMSDDKTGDEHILVVDDEEPIGQLIRQMLERLGYRVTLRFSSVKALQVFKENPDAFDMVFTDMHMPKITGERLAAEVIAVKPNIPIIICTGFSNQISEEKAEALGINGFLMKPVVKSELARMVRRVLDDAVK
jgi:PAS domain S-box-containing protein